ncbi:MAG: hypothetical protein PWP27_2342 [Clostridiales bacterium]|nr:hypothetical protein [Clostridiales bacterium]
MVVIMSFILTMWDVNMMKERDGAIGLKGFILTMWDVNP